MPKANSLKSMGNFAAFCAILFGLLAAFSGTDIPIILGIYVIGTIFLCFKNNLWKQVFDANKAPLLIYLALIALLAYMLGSSIKSAQVLKSTQQYLLSYILVFGFFIFAIRSAAISPQTSRRGIVAGFFVLFSLLLIEAIFKYPMYCLANPNMAPTAIEFNLGRAAYILLILFWPTFLAMRNLKINSAIIALTFLGTLYLSTRFGIDLNFVIFCAVSIAALIAMKFPKAVLFLISFAYTALIMLAPKIYPFLANLAKNYLGANIPLSYGRRADMWLYAGNRIQEKPIYGWGLDGARQFNEKVQYGGFEWNALQMHPHSAPMHIWLEGGVLGAILICFIIIAALFLVLKSAKLSGGDGWAYVGAYSTILAGWAVSYSMWEQWLWAVCLFAIGFVYIASDGNKAKKSPEKTLMEI